MSQAVSPYLFQGLTLLWAALLRSLPLIILMGFLGFALGLLALWLLRRRGFFQRSSRPWKIFTYSYYLTVPLACALLAISVSATLKLRHETRQLLESTLQPAVHRILSENVAALRAPYPQFSVADVEGRLRDWLRIDYLESGTGTWNAVKARIGRRAVSVYNRWIVPIAIKALLVQCGTGALNSGRDASVLTDCVIRNAESILIKQVWKQLNGFFHGMLIASALTFLGIMAIQFLEAGIYFFWYRKKYACPSPTPAIP